MSHDPVRQTLLRTVRSAIDFQRLNGQSDAMLAEGYVRSKVAAVAALLGASPEDTDWATRTLEAEFSVKVEEVQVIDREGSSRWTPVVGQLQRDFQEMLTLRGWGQPVVWALEDTTSEILSRCGNPADDLPWQRRGMVVGQVQSGKTTSYTALIAAAVDAGYRNIVVLGGRTNDLRHQTQQRIDEGIVGQESRFDITSLGAGSHPISQSGIVARVIGVGHVRAGHLHDVWSPPLLLLTSQDLLSGTTTGNGDFDTRRARANNLAGTATTLSVIKKNTTILRNLTSWLSHSGRISDGPLLVIDDEADDASIDVSREDTETPSAINRCIRDLLRSAARATYVAYTATPYANVMIDPDAQTDEYGQDLFPGDFIALLDAPDNYMGAEEFLRPSGNRQHHVSVPDSHGWIMRGRTHGPVPASLERAVCEFITVSAARRARLEREGKPARHASMLIHCAVQVAVQESIAAEVTQFVRRIRDAWQFPTAASQPLRTRLRDAWDDLAPHQDSGRAVEWAELQPHMAAVLHALDVATINGRTKETLNYQRAGDPLVVIAIGGQKLSRGLTLEGLTTSYQLRSTTLFDTLMQMGRWMGYRQGYEDLCRVHTTEDILTAFNLVQEADLELRRDLRDLQELGTTPRMVGIRIRHSPGMQVTARAKLRTSVRGRAGQAGRTVELTWFQREHAAANMETASSFVASLGTPARHDGRRLIWDNVPVEQVLDALQAHREPLADSALQPVTRGQAARDYIDRARAIDPGKLSSWTVVLAGHDSAGELDIGGHPGHPAGRKATGDETIRIHVISDPLDEQYAPGAVLSSNRMLAKAGRSPSHGLLIGYPLSVNAMGRDGEVSIPTFSWCVSFPPDPELDSNEYVLNRRASEVI